MSRLKNLTNSRGKKITLFYVCACVCSCVYCVQELEEGLASHEAVLADLIRSGEHIIAQLSSPDGPLLQDKLDNLTQRCAVVHTRVAERRCR